MDKVTLSKPQKELLTSAAGEFYKGRLPTMGTLQKTIEILRDGGYIALSWRAAPDERAEFADQVENYVQMAKAIIEEDWHKALDYLKSAADYQSRYDAKCWWITNKGRDVIGADY